ncbi:hypothetical protein BDP55DRAFT_704411 [Colletotrichum godetiae]|uniref:Short-chain dehydrogenase n=1 Tax=Colletotrichum godetiae TaxID=1209918 RepID=A0AAJ0AJU8_9PEZI|nr:uncharacterized protein BDP55DRAFT_704411 [Colletotrichum godetiae]KAK1675221.1 hypothetical protein BDP55DRAFT_704411 [Colletotrichum godetiae]
MPDIRKRDSRSASFLLVGATSGIGAAMADKLVENGAKVIAVGRRQERLDAFAKKHGSIKAASIRFDITDRAGLDGFVNRVVDEFLGLDCDKVIPTGLIITGTHLSLIPAVTLPAYSASKAALHTYVYSLRQQLQGSSTKISTKIIEILAPLMQIEFHDYIGKEQGRSMGMPVDVFADEKYKQLVLGTEHILVGSVGPEEPFLELFKARQKQLDDLSNFMLSLPPG